MNELAVPTWIALTASVLLIGGGLVTLIGACGLVTMRDFYERMHPPTMGSGLGVACVIVSAVLLSSAMAGRPVIHPIAIGLFVVLSAPVSAMTLIRAAIARAETKKPSPGETGLP